MGLFDRIFKKEEIIYQNDDIAALANAAVIPVENVSDPMFAQEMLGQTIAFDLYDGTVVCPCNGTLEVMYPTGHAFAVRCENGMGILVHIGIDTVRMKGKGFKVYAKQNDKVKAGQKLVDVNLDLIKDSGYDPVCMMIITEPVDEKKVTFTCGNSVKRGEIINK